MKREPIKMPDVISPEMLAPCGVVCTACVGRLKQTGRCGGCLGPEEHMSARCRNCDRKACAGAKGLTWCFECEEFPCKRIKTLDKSYRTRYGVSLVQNGLDAREMGVEAFLAGQRQRWLCPECGGIVCQHDGICRDCDYTERKKDR